MQAYASGMFDSWALEGEAYRLRRARSRAPTAFHTFRKRAFAQIGVRIDMLGTCQVACLAGSTIRITKALAVIDGRMKRLIERRYQ